MADQHVPFRPEDTRLYSTPPAPSPSVRERAEEVVIGRFTLNVPDYARRSTIERLARDVVSALHREGLLREGSNDG